MDVDLKGFQLPERDMIMSGVSEGLNLQVGEVCVCVCGGGGGICG